MGVFDRFIKKPILKSNQNVLKQPELFNFGTIAKKQTAQAEKAVFAARTELEADKKLRDVSSKVWQQATEEEKDAIYLYTEDNYWNINNALRQNEEISLMLKYDINDITNVISKSSYDFDMIVHRGANYGRGETNNFFKVPTKLLETGSIEELERELLGQEIADLGFFSTSAMKYNTFTNDNPINMHINVPKGFKALYTEPFSALGKGARRDWDGISQQSNFSNEMEVLLQRNSSFKINDIKREDEKLHFYMDLISQEPYRL